jgi:hypothetical protein
MHRYCVFVYEFGLINYKFIFATSIYLQNTRNPQFYIQ